MLFFINRFPAVHSMYPPAGVQYGEKRLTYFIMIGAENQYFFTGGPELSFLKIRWSCSEGSLRIIKRQCAECFVQWKRETMHMDW